MIEIISGILSLIVVLFLWWANWRMHKAVNELVNVIDWLWARHALITDTLDPVQRVELEVWERVHPYGDWREVSA